MGMKCLAQGQRAPVDRTCDQAIKSPKLSLHGAPLHEEVMRPSTINQVRKNKYRKKQTKAIMDIMTETMLVTRFRTYILIPHLGDSIKFRRQTLADEQWYKYLKLVQR